MKEKREITKTNWKALDQMSDKDIDYSDIPPLDENFFQHAKLIIPERKQSLTIRYDKEVVDYFKNVIGRGYQTQMNSVLKAYVRSQKRSSS